MVSVSPYSNSTQKRIFDIILAVIIFIIGLPLLVLVSIIVLFTAGSPILFAQERIGQKKRKFVMYKFRTMYVGAEKDQRQFTSLNQAPQPMFKANNDPRFVGTGKLLSRLGVDELPQLINIFKGEMSFVGPRPLPVKEAAKLDKTWDFRYKTKPGIFSHWSLAANRYDNLSTWKRLDAQTVVIASVSSEIIVISSVLLRLLTSFIIADRKNPSTAARKV